jgi:hypothetical protein
MFPALRRVASFFDSSKMGNVSFCDSPENKGKLELEMIQLLTLDNKNTM